MALTPEVREVLEVILEHGETGINTELLEDSDFIVITNLEELYSDLAMKLDVSITDIRLLFERR